MSFVNKYYSRSLYAKIGMTSPLEDLDVYDAEAFEIIFLSIKKVERELAKKGAKR